MTGIKSIDEIASRQEEMVASLIRWCNQNSSTDNLDGLASMREILSGAFEVLEADEEIIAPQAIERVDEHGNVVPSEVGPALRWRKRPDRERSVFLGIHMDTVYPIGHPLQSCVWLDNGHLNGPGVSDAKGGLMVMLEALRAFEQSPHADEIGWEVFVNADEEIGSPSSAHYFREIANDHDFGLLFEPTLADGTMVNRRKGSGNLTVVVHGISAHAGREFEKGRNAIVELARLIERFHAINDEREGVILNVGKIQGGGAVNVVPDFAMAHLNARVAKESDGEWLIERVRNILEIDGKDSQNANPPEFRRVLHGGLTSPPKIPDSRVRTLESWIETSGNILGQSIQWKSTGGTCDGNKLFAYGLPCVDTLGVRGGAIHSRDEFLIPESLVERAQLCALLLHRYAAGELHGLG